MKRCTKLAFAIVLSAVAVLPAVAQDAFPDNSANHWAYEALVKMKKDGLLVGYPDGLFRGGRPASRYELAVAMHAAYAKLKGETDGLDSALKLLSDKVNSVDQGDKSDDIKALKDLVGELRNSVDGMKAWNDDIKALRRASDTFEKELESLGVDVEAMKKNLLDLSARVTALEKKKLPVDITGDINFWMGAGNSRDDYYGLNKDGRIVGTSDHIGPVDPTNPVLKPAGLTQDVTILHEAAFTLKSTNDVGLKWKGTFVMGNMIGGADNVNGLPQSGIAFGNKSDVFNPTNGNSGAAGLFGYNEAASDFYFQDLSVSLDGRARGVNYNVEAGRVGYKLSPYTFQRPDTTSYFSNSRWDDGRYTFDGAILGFDFGPAKLNVFGGRNSGILTNKGYELNPLRTGSLGGPFSDSSGAGGARMDIDRSLGMNVRVPVSKIGGGLNLSYLWLDSDQGLALSTSQLADRLTVFSADADAKIGPAQVSGGYRTSNLKGPQGTISDTDNKAWNARVELAKGRYGVFGEYREIDANYLAPGDWGRMGILRNPTNIKGFSLGAHVDLNSKVRLTASGEFNKGVSDAYSAFTKLGTDSKVDTYKLRIDYKANQKLTLFGSYEDSRFRDMVGTFVGDPQYKWTTIGFGYGLGSAARLTMQYELSDIDNDYQATVGGKFKGGFLTTQLTLKF